MKCPNCQKEMELEETYTYYDNDTEIEVAEHWWCPFCDASPIRFREYRLVREHVEE